MYFTIQNKQNKPILRGLLQGFGTHTSASEHNSLNTLAFYACLQDIEVLSFDELKEFEDMYRLDTAFVNSEVTTKDPEKRNYYVFMQPKLRDKFDYIITNDGYK